MTDGAVVVNDADPALERHRHRESRFGHLQTHTVHPSPIESFPARQAVSSLRICQCAFVADDLLNRLRTFLRRVWFKLNQMEWPKWVLTVSIGEDTKGHLRRMLRVIRVLVETSCYEVDQFCVEKNPMPPNKCR